MFIKQEDYNYFMGLFESLGEAGKKKFLELIKKAGSDRTGSDMTKIRIVVDDILDSRAVDPEDLITRTMIKKSYKAAKEGK